MKSFVKVNMKIIFMSTGRHTGAWNMAFDKLMMDSVAAGTYEIVIRTYGWDPACISLGRCQKLSSEIDLDKLHRDGYDAVKRPTGGRAVWHGNEVTYSVIAPAMHPFVSGTISESLRKVNEPITRAMQLLGVDVEVKSTDHHRIGRKVPLNPCFTSHSRYETGTIDGRKLIGSAQLRSKDVFLEHGSILIGNDQLELLEYLPEERPKKWMNMMRNHLTDGIACLSEFLPDIEAGSIENALFESFNERFDQKVERVDFNSIITKRHEELMKEFLIDEE